MKARKRKWEWSRKKINESEADTNDKGMDKERSWAKRFNRIYVILYVMDEFNQFAKSEL